jgi:uncharacterized membrane protein
VSSRRRPAPPRWLILWVALSAASCTSVAKITTLAENDCEHAFTGALERVLAKEGETPPNARQLAESTSAALRSYDLGPRPFLVESPSGVDYSFFVEKKGAACLLRLYGRQKGFTSYTNNLTYIATEPLAPCQCAE